MDRLLDRGSSGPLFLQRPEIAGMVADALGEGEHRFHRYQLHAFVVMLGTQGRAFWQDQSYDHLIRSDAEFDRIRAYIEQNPVTAGLVATAEQFQWSSAKAA